MSVLVVGLLTTLLLTACGTAMQAAPMCTDDGRNTLVLIAQSVPTATHVPCLTGVPTGWLLNDVQIKSGETRVTFGSDADGGRATATMLFTDSCELGDAVEVPSAEGEARRYEDVDDVTNGYRGTSYLVFEGGCMSLAFNVVGDGWSALLNDASAAVALTSRADLRRFVRDHSDGVIQDF